jgi:hypothetical protein
MDGLNWLRFANQPDLLAAWRSASNVVAAGRSFSSAAGSEHPPSGPDDLPPAA